MGPLLTEKYNDKPINADGNETIFDLDGEGGVSMTLKLKMFITSWKSS